MDLDEFDRRLLNALQDDNQQTGDQLAERVGLSAAACLRRVKKLREGGAIERDVSILSQRARGRHLTIVALVTLERHTPSDNDMFKTQMRSDETVTQCYHVTGSADYVLVLTVPDLEAYEEFTKRYFYQKHVKRFETFASLSRVKFNTFTPL